MEKLTGFNAIDNNIYKYVLAFMPAIIYFIIVITYAVNLPFMDDYFAIVDFLNRYKVSHGTDSLVLLFDQHNEHRILSSRIWYVLYFIIFKSINFKHFILISNIQLLIVFVILVIFIKRVFPEKWLCPAIIAGLSLFDINNFENADFAMAGMQNYGVIFLFVLSLYFYSFSNKRCNIIGLLFQIICVFSSGNGIIASGFVMLYAILSKSKLKIILSSVGFLVFGPLYFWHYTFLPSLHQSINISKVGLYLIRFMSSQTLYPNKLLATIMGCVILVSIPVLMPIKKKFRISEEVHPFIAILGFVISSMIITSIVRYNTGGDFPAPRYYIYAHFIVIILSVFLLIKCKDKKKYGLIGAAFTCLLFFVYRANFEFGILGFESINHTLRNSKYAFPVEDIPKAFCDKSCELKIYCIEENRH